MLMYQYTCPQCGNVITTDQPLPSITCPRCGRTFQTAPPQGQPPYQQPYQQPHGNDVFAAGPSGKSRGVAALLAILVGALGIQYFYIGKNTAGIVCLCISLFSCGVLGAAIWLASIVQGIIMLTLTEEEFERRYIHDPATFVF